MTTANEFFVAIKKHPYEALFTAGLAAVLLALPVVAFAGQDLPEQPPTLEGKDGPERSVGVVLDPELDTPRVEPPMPPEEDAIPQPGSPESNVDEQIPEVTIEGESEAEDPACCTPDESHESSPESERDVSDVAADRARPSTKSRATAQEAVGSSKHSGVATRSSKGGEKGSGAATSNSSETQSSTSREGSSTTASAKTQATSSTESSDQSASSNGSVATSTSNTPVAGSRVTPAPGRTYIVRRGDCLWLITKAALGKRVSIVRINNGWQRVWRANASTVGGNPHLIFPGQVLRIPREL
jgi:nucleoid-associated protein YgaU